MMRSNEELKNVLKVLTYYREYFDQFNMFGENTWEKYDTMIYHTTHALNHSVLFELDSEDEDNTEISDLYEWLDGYNDSDFYEDILEELEELKEK